jgi:hypothetical protein
MTETTPADTQLLANLQSRVQKLRKADRRLGLEILAAISPRPEQRSTATALLDDSDVLAIVSLPIPLDITASLDGGFELLDEMFPHADWWMAHIAAQTRRGRSLVNSDGPYSIEIILSEIIHTGHGWTRPTCLLDGLLRALQSLDAEAKADAITQVTAVTTKDPCLDGFH